MYSSFQAGCLRRARMLTRGVRLRPMRLMAILRRMARTITTALRPDAAPFQHPRRGQTTPHGYTERCEEQSRADDAAGDRPEAYPDRSQPNSPCVHDTHQHHDEHGYGSGKGDDLWNIFKHLSYLENVI